MIEQLSAWFSETNEALLIGGGAAAFLLFIFMWIARFLYLCRPSEILIFSGRKHRLPDGTIVGSRVVFGGRAWRIPLIETVQRMQMLSMPIDVAVQGAYTKVGIPLKVRAIAVIKLSSDPSVVMNAIERFLGRGQGDIQQVAKETLEGNLRGVLATLTPEEVNEDRLKFADSLAAEVEQDLSKLGLHLDVLKIQHVTDDANYLASIGRERIAHVVRDAEIAESNARNEAAKEAAAAEMRAKVAEADAERGGGAEAQRISPGEGGAGGRGEVRRGARRAGRPGGARHRRAGAAGGAPGAGDGAPAGGGGGAVGDQPRGGRVAGGGAGGDDRRGRPRQRHVAAPGRRRLEGGRAVGAGHVPHQQARGDHRASSSTASVRSSSGRCSWSTAVTA